MKGSCTLVAASVLAASTVALSSSSSSAGDGNAVTFYPGPINNEEGSHSSLGKNGAPNINTFKSSSNKEKYSPRFDALRFIETLITAHR